MAASNLQPGGNYQFMFKELEVGAACLDQFDNDGDGDEDCADSDCADEDCQFDPDCISDGKTCAAPIVITPGQLPY